jgi:hypothetical protein
MTAPQHYALGPCPAASGMELVERWKRHLTQVQTEIDRETYGNGRLDVYHLENASNIIEKALEALDCEMNRIQDGE